MDVDALISVGSSATCILEALLDNHCIHSLENANYGMMASAAPNRTGHGVQQLAIPKPS